MLLRAALRFLLAAARHVAATHPRLALVTPALNEAPSGRNLRVPAGTLGGAVLWAASSTIWAR